MTVPTVRQHGGVHIYENDENAAALRPLIGIHDPDRLRDLLEAVLGISSDLSLPHVLRRIAEAAVRVIGARYGALGVLSDQHAGLDQFIHVGISQEQADAIGPLPEGRGILGLLILEPRPIRLADLGQHPESYGFPAHHPPMDSFLGVPIRIRGQVFGNLYLTEKQAAPEFSEEDEQLAVALAGAAAVAIENARLHARVRDLTLVEDRDRIAADLHDTVIQRLFATGLALQGTLPVINPPEAASRVEIAVADLDETIRQIRSAIFALQAPRIAGRTLRGEILSLVSEATASLGFEPHLHLDGPIDSAVGEEAAGHLLSTLREALSNVVRHAGASRVDVTVEVSLGNLHVEVRDNGVGLPPAVQRSGRGLTNMGRRAEGLGGSMSLSPGPGGNGTVLSWRVPLNARGT